jgi:hypothetical protein
MLPTAAGLVLGAPIPSASALVVGLGAASNWAVLEIGTGTVNMLDPSGSVLGNVGIGAGAQLNQSNAAIVGDLFLGTPATYNPVQPALVTGAITENTTSQSLLTQAAKAAISAS